jgi:GNAT superfamily N-acetyltransferase
VTDRSVTVRPARPDDRPFVLETAKRLAEFGPPPWRTPEDVVTAESRVLHAFFDGTPGSDIALLVAEGPGGEQLGFAYLETLIDYFDRRPHGHVAELAVTREAEGRGAAGALLAAAEVWSRGQGYRTLTLNVFEKNQHARDVYEKRGFRPETLRYIKSLD